MSLYALGVALTPLLPLHLLGTPPPLKAVRTPASTPKVVAVVCSMYIPLDGDIVYLGSLARLQSQGNRSVIFFFF